MSEELIIRSRRVITPEGVKEASIYIHDGKIVAPESNLRRGRGRVVDVGDRVILPGLVDPHVHVNEPGRTEWEGYETATQAAAAGGVTTIVDMPLNSNPVTTTQRAFQTKLESARNQCWVDCGFWGGVVPGNLKELKPMVTAGVRGFKAFLIHSGIDDFPQVTESDLREAMKVLARLGVPLLVHAELEGQADHESLKHNPGKYLHFLASRPAAWEDEAIRMMIRLCRETRCSVHIVHLSSASALPDIARAKNENLPLTVETCPHYLFFEAETIPDGQTQYKCMPPIRGADNQQRLWEGLANGLIDFIVTDHSPCTPGLKLLEQGDFLHAWGGIASLQFGLSSVWTQASKKGFSLDQVVNWMSTRPAQFIGLGNRKGAIAPGYDADLVIFNPDIHFTPQPTQIFHRHKVTPYREQLLKGQVEITYLRGKKIYESGEFIDKPVGEMVLHPPLHYIK